MLKMFSIFTIFTFAVVTSAVAQQRSPNDGTNSVKRVWPRSGVWEVSLTRHRESPELQCNVLTGWQNANTGEGYLWGWRDYKGELAFFIIDKNSRAVSGRDIAVFIDDIKVTLIPAAIRLSVDGANFVGGPVPKGKNDTIIELLRSGGAVKLVTDNYSYSASLSGSGQAMQYFDECRRQADRLNALQNKSE